MENKDKTLSTLIEKGVKEIIIREGEALPIAPIQPVEIIGTIDAPSRFSAEREFDPKKSHCFFRVTEGEIVLIVNEQEFYDSYEVKGVILIGRKFRSLGINDPDISYSPQKLANRLKFMRTLFPKLSEHTNICSTLKNFKASIDKKVESLKDTRGNSSQIFKETVESNVPESFTMNMPLFEGEPSKSFEVNVVLEVQNGEIRCFLESLDAQDIIETDMEKRVMEEVEKLKGKTTLIAQ